MHASDKCASMVTKMASAYNGLLEEDRERVFMIAVGDSIGERKAKGNEPFCQGFAACTNDQWWKDWSVEKRDVFFFTKQADDSWEYYCSYNMDSGYLEFNYTIQEMLCVVDTQDGNETQIDVEEICSIPCDECATSTSSKMNYAIFASTLGVVGGLFFL